MSGSAPASRKPFGERVWSVAIYIPFILVHLLALSAIFIRPTVGLVGACLGLYCFRMWAVTGGYHRYFSHRSFKTSRAFQFVLAFLAQTSAQKGALWWAAHHRNHHRYSDQEGDTHSPVRDGFWWSHVGWILDRKNDATPLENIKDLARFPELMWLNKYHLVPSVSLGVALFFIGGWPLLVWAPCCCGTAPSSSTRSATSSARAGTTPATRAATTCSSRSSRWVKGGTTTTTTISRARDRASSGGRSTSPTTR